MARRVRWTVGAARLAIVIAVLMGVVAALRLGPQSTSDWYNSDYPEFLYNATVDSTAFQITITEVLLEAAKSADSKELRTWHDQVAGSSPSLEDFRSSLITACTERLALLHQRSSKSSPGRLTRAYYSSGLSALYRIGHIQGARYRFSASTQVKVWWWSRVLVGLFWAAVAFSWSMFLYFLIRLVVRTTSWIFRGFWPKPPA